jgi:PAS domain-containing protein
VSLAANIAGIALERDRATQALQRLNQELEMRVKQRTIALQESETRYRLLSEFSPVGIFRFDEPLNCIYVNDRWSEMTGKSKKSALGSGWMETLPPEDRDRMMALWAEGFDSSSLIIRPVG